MITTALDLDSGKAECLRVVAIRCFRKGSLGRKICTPCDVLKHEKLPRGVPVALPSASGCRHGRIHCHGAPFLRPNYEFSVCFSYVPKMVVSDTYVSVSWVFDTCVLVCRFALLVHVSKSPAFDTPAIVCWRTLFSHPPSGCEELGSGGAHTCLGCGRATDTRRFQKRVHPARVVLSCVALPLPGPKIYSPPLSSPPFMRTPRLRPPVCPRAASGVAE